MVKLVKKKFKITGMHCSSCSMMIDGELEDLPGVRSASTNFAKSECEVEFEEERVNTNSLLSAIKSVGYEASLAS